MCGHGLICVALLVVAGWLKWTRWSRSITWMTVRRSHSRQALTARLFPPAVDGGAGRFPRDLSLMLVAQVTIDRRDGSAVFDFTGTGPQVYGP